METRVLATDPAEALKTSLAEAVARLRNGEIVALPTETVYGLAGDASNDLAVAKIFEAKERPAFDPLIVHLPKREDLAKIAVIPEELRKDLNRLMEAFWPGALTFVLPKAPEVSDLVTSGLPTVAVRMSANAVFKQVLREFGVPLAAPSANRFGRISPTSAAAVLEELSGRIPLILDGGACSEGLESTIIKVSPGPSKPFIQILRHGPVTADDLKRLGKIVSKKQQAAEAIEAPGQTSSHYAPRTPLRILDEPERFRPETGKRYALLSYRGDPSDGYIDLADFVEVLALSPGAGKMPEAAVRLFHLMRQLDRLGADEILVEPLPERGLGVAIMDRLRRAAKRE